MQSSYVRSSAESFSSPASQTESFHVSHDFVAVLLFSLLGLTVSMAVFSFVPLAELAALLAY